MRNTIKVLLGFTWLAVIGYCFFIANHPYYLESFSFIGRIIPAVLVFGLITAALTPLIRSKITLWKIILSFFLLAAGLLTVSQINADLAIYNGGTIFQDEQGWGVLPLGGELEEGMVEMVTDETIISDASSFISILPEELSTSFTKVNLFSSLLFTGSKLLLAMLFLAILTLASFAIGQKLLKFAKINGFLLSVAVGLGVYMGIMFLLGLFGLISLSAIIGIAIILTAISWKEAWTLIKTAATKSYPIKINPKDLSFWICLSAILVFIYNALEIIRPMPIGWDDSNYYLYIPEKIASLGSLMDGSGGMYNWELINTIASYSSDALLPLFTNFWGGMLAMGALYLLLSTFLSKKTSLTLTSLFYIFPAVIFQSAVDVKNDLPLLFFILMAFFAFRKSWVWLAAILIGISIGIKATAGIALIVLTALLFNKKQGIAVAFFFFAVLLFLVETGNLFMRDILSDLAINIIRITALTGSIIALITTFIKTKFPKKAGVFLLLVSLVIAPWFAKNTIIDGMPVDTITYLGSNPSNADVNFQDVIETCTAASLDEELNQYIVGMGEKTGELNAFSFFKMPWQMTMNPGFDGIYVDVSLVFLGLLPLFLWYLIEKKDKLFRLLAAISALYFLILIFYFNGIIWYGFAGVCMLLLMIGIMLEFYEKDTWQNEKILSSIINSAIAVTAFMVIFVRAASFGGLEDLAYLGKIIDAEQYIEIVSPGTMITAMGIEKNALIYKIGGSTAYFLADKNTTFFKDETLDSYMCLREQHSDDEIIEILKDKEIDYIAFDYTILLEENTDPELAERYLDLLNFGTENLEIIVSKEDYILFAIQ